RGPQRGLRLHPIAARPANSSRPSDDDTHGTCAVSAAATQRHARLIIRGPALACALRRRNTNHRRPHRALPTHHRHAPHRRHPPSPATGPQNAHPYPSTATAINAVGPTRASAHSAPVTVGAPTAPTAVTATAGIHSAVLTWLKPANNNGSAITAYIITPYLGN